jgi:tripartite-type tricarboxylate transporter receptor subunit TctC
MPRSTAGTRWWRPRARQRIITFLNGHVRTIIADGDFQKRMIELGGEPVTGSPEELDARLKSDVEMWAGVVKKAGLEPN